MNLAPSCDECGYNADRKKCAADLGGYCKAYEQDNLIAYKDVIENIRDSSDNLKEYWMWRLYIPLHLLYDFTKKENNNLLDFYDEGGHKKSRNNKNDYNSLRQKGAVSIWSQYEYNYKLSDRGISYIENVLKVNK